MMNSKEAVNAVLKHENPEYIPLGTYAIDCDIVKKIIGHETYVRNKLKITKALWAGKRKEVCQSLKEDSCELFKKLDCIDIIIPFKECMILPPKDYEPPKMKKITDKLYQDEKENSYMISEKTNEVTCINKKREYSKDDFMKEPKDNEIDQTIFEAYDFLIDKFKDERFIAGASGGFEPMMLLNGMEDGLCYYYTDPDLVKKAILHTTKYHNILDKYYIKEGVDQVFIEQDFASTKDVLLSPEKFYEFCFLAMKQRIDNIKKYRKKVILHSCGKTFKYFDFFIKAGVDMYQSLQTGANMDIKRLKEEYGDRLTFWGGVSCENLIGGTMEDVRENVRYSMKHGKPNGGFILGPSHSIAYGTKYDNFMAMLDEYNKLKYI